MNIPRIFSEKSGKVLRYFISVCKRAAEVLSVHFFNPYVYGEAVRLAEAEKRYAVGDLGTYALIGKQPFFKFGRVEAFKLRNALGGNAAGGFAKICVPVTRAGAFEKFRVGGGKRGGGGEGIVLDRKSVV